MPFDMENARAQLADLAQSDPARVLARIRSLARPRMTGTEAATAVEAELRRSFEELGYEMEEHAFSFSTWPGRFGICVAGGAMAVAGVAATWLLVVGLPGAALVVLLLMMGVALVPLLALDQALKRLPWGRVEARNLLFRMPGYRPAWIIMAHRDSKSQLVPTLVRTAAVSVGVITWIALVALAFLWFGGEPFRFTTLTILVGVLLFLAGALLALSWAGNESPGALDNASGLAALLEVAAASRENGDIAFLITDGEELGLVGARMGVSRLPPVQGVINVDSLDDRGVFLIAEGYGWRRKGSAPQLAAALLTAAAALDLPMERRPLPRAIPVDHLPVAAAGIPTLSLLRGRWQSLLRVHSSSDDTDRLDGTGAAAGATLLTAAMRLLHHNEAAHLAGRRSTSA
jgi:hypothetical protein